MIIFDVIYKFLIMLWMHAGKIWGVVQFACLKYNSRVFLLLLLPLHDAIVLSVDSVRRSHRIKSSSAPQTFINGTFETEPCSCRPIFFFWSTSRDKNVRSYFFSQSNWNRFKIRPSSSNTSSSLRFISLIQYRQIQMQSSVFFSLSQQSPSRTGSPWQDI